MEPHLAAQTRHLQDALDSASFDMNVWTTALPFILRHPTCYDAESLCVNILDYVNPIYRNVKLYFSARYNHSDSPSFGNGDKGWKELLNDLERAGMEEAGLNLISNGGHSDTRWIVCGTGFKRYQGTKQHEHSPSKQQYRCETLHSDRKNSRGQVGMKMPRKTRTKRTLDLLCRCPFRFVVKVDQFGFYLVGGRGNATHCYHPKLTRGECAVPTRLICPEEKDIMVSVGTAKANDGVGRNVHFRRSGNVIPRSQVRYINGFQNTKNNPEHDNVRRLEPGESSVDKLLKSFREKQFDHCVLFHHVKQRSQSDEGEEVHTIAGDSLVVPNTVDDVVLNEHHVFTGNDGISQTSTPPPCSPASLQVLTFPDTEVGVMQLFAKEHRQSLEVDDKQDLMMGCAWTTPPEQRLFRMFSDVLHIDCTADTNIESRPFLSVTGRDSNGHMFSVIRAFLPNERAWVFRWIFQTVMPALLGKDYIGRVNVIITDGDACETSQLDIAIARYFPNVCRVRCGWHIVDRGWKKRCPGTRSVSLPNQAAFASICNQIKAWIYSWMSPRCETEEEYKISKSLLCAYLRHNDFLRVASETVADQILTFIREHVEPHEAFYCFHLRRHVRHFDTYTNSAHEGTNNGVKSAAAPILPQHSLDRSASILNQNALIKANANSIRSAKIVSTKALWSKLPTAQKLTHKGEGLVTAQWMLRKNYVCQRVGDTHWHVALKSTHNYHHPTVLIPQFYRVRKVSLTNGRFLLCSCLHFERVGIPCRHQMHVLASLQDGYKGITHHDVSVMWWNEFARYAFSSERGCQVISSLYQKLLFNDVCGPSIPNEINFPPVVQVILQPSLVVKPAREACRNYDVQTINSALKSSNYGASKQGSSHDDDDRFLMSYDDDESLDFGPCNTQQETNTYGTDDPLLVFPAVDNSHAIATNNSPYSVLFPLLKELTSILDGNCSIDRLSHYKDMLSNAIVKEKRELLERSNGLSSVQTAGGKMVSSGVQSNKRHRSHGTRHM